MPLAPKVISIRKVKKHVHQGSAHLVVRVPGPGELALEQTPRVKGTGQPVGQAGKARVLIRPRKFSQAAQRLLATGKVRVRATITFTPEGMGEPKLKSKALRLGAEVIGSPRQRLTASAPV